MRDTTHDTKNPKMMSIFALKVLKMVKLGILGSYQPSLPPPPSKKTQISKWIEFWNLPRDAGKPNGIIAIPLGIDRPQVSNQ